MMGLPWRTKGAIEIAHDLPGPFGGSADNDTVGFHKVVHGNTFAEEFRIGNDIEFYLCNFLRWRS